MATVLQKGCRNSGVMRTGTKWLIVSRNGQENMEREKRAPKRLYKYRDVTARTLNMVVGDQLHFADPSTFNDPLDTRPSLDADVDGNELGRILRILIERSTAADMRAGARAMKLTDARSKDWIEKHSRRQAELRISEIEYGASNPEYDFETALKSQLRYCIELELLRGNEKGIVSFAERDDCPLMWSHYGDQHRGICLGYSVPEKAIEDVEQVAYGGDRLVKASDVGAMLDGDDEARARVDAAVMLRKAESWSYEQEWRLIGGRGTAGSPLELEEIIFGMKCKESVKYTVMKALEDRSRSVEFYEMREERGTFNLGKHELVYDDELFVHFPRRDLSVLEGFEDLTAGNGVS